MKPQHQLMNAPSDIRPWDGDVRP